MPIVGKDQHIGIIDNLYVIMPRQQIVDEVVVFHPFPNCIGKIQMKYWLYDFGKRPHNVDFVGWNRQSQEVFASFSDEHLLSN